MSFAELNVPQNHVYLFKPQYGCGHRALGISRESLLRFMNRRVVRRRDPQSKNLMTVRPGVKPSIDGCANS